jgi:hypothetical protein
MTDGQTAKQNDGQTANDEQTAKNILQNDLYSVMYNYIKDTYNQKRVISNPWISEANRVPQRICIFAISKRYAFAAVVTMALSVSAFSRPTRRCLD